ncbi:toxin VasX [Gilliamella sp. CG13]|uniref:toxin VasX n=1 Tax=Gilliamella sp. CG13 TaxID=3351502 RepID=UPI003987C44E
METNNNSNTDFNDNDIQSNTDAPVVTTELIHEAKENMALSNGKCGACQRTGFPLFLVRKSVVPKFFKNSETNIWESGMLPLKNHEPTTAFTHFSYVYRTLREGYVYILLQKNKSAKGWQGTDLNLLKVKVFEVTKSGAFRLREFRDVKGTRPKELPESCITEGHQFKAKFITLDNKIYDKAWIAYSPYRWDKDVVEHYRKNEDDRNERFTVVDLTQTEPSKLTANGERSFSFSDFTREPVKAAPVEGEKQESESTTAVEGPTKRYLLEMECNKQEVLDYFNKEQLDARRQKSKEEQDKAQKNASQNSNTQAQSKPASVGIKDTKLNKEIAKGSFYAQNYDLKNQLENTEASILQNYRKLFCSASQFNTLKKEVGGLNDDFSKTIDGYKGEAYDNSNYKTAEIGVILVEDSLGIAEELAVQRRQLLSPVVDGLAGRSQEQTLAIQKRLQANLGKTVKDLILEGKDEIGDEIDPSIIQSFYTENLIDLDYNKQYQYVNRIPEYLRYVWPVGYWLERKVNQVMSNVKANVMGPRKKAIEDYFNKQITYAKNKPLLYFKPETSYARNQYTSIESYKDILKSENQIQDGSECVLFAFFDPDARYSQQLKKYAEQQAKEYLTKQPYSGNASQDEMDDILVTYVVGDKEFAKEQNFTIAVPAYTGLNEVAKFFYFRFVSQVSLSSVNSDNTPPLGDYVPIYLTKNQKAQILTIFKNSQEAQDVLMDNLDVIAVKFPNAKECVAEWKKNQAWKDKHGQRVNDDTLQKYQQLDKQLYNNLTNYVKNVSKDYFTYLLWLFGDHNPVQFWLKECTPDTSDRHINALNSLLVILDSDFTGNLYLDEQAMLWSLLINNEQSIYRHFLEGHPYSLFNVASGNVAEADLQLTENVKAIIANQGAGQEQGTTDVDNPLSGIISLTEYIDPISNLELPGNVKVGAYLTEELVKLSMTNIAKTLSHSGTYNLNTAVANQHLIQAMNMFTTASHGSYRVKVPVSNLQDFLNNLGSSAKVVYANHPGGNLVTTAGDRIRGRYSATRDQFTLRGRDITRATGQFVEFDVLLTFENDIERLEFESKKTTSRGTANVNAFKDVKAIKYEELQAAKFGAEQNWRKEVLDTSATGIVNVLTLTYQFIQISLLNERLKTLTDSALIDKISKAIFRTHLDIALTASEAIVTGTKLVALFGERNDNLLKILKELNKAGEVITKAAKVLALVDSIGELGKAFKALARGDTGSVVYTVTSIIGIVGLMLGLSGPWGIALMLAPHIINFLFGTYDDASEWDEMEKWINRSIFGKFNRVDLFPPYPISDTGNYLSEQDFYLASRKGFCRTAHYEVKLKDLVTEAMNKNANRLHTKKSFTIDWGTDDQTEIGEQIKGAKSGTKYNLHLVMQLPDFVRDKAKFKGKVVIRHAEGEMETILAVSHGGEGLKIKTVQLNAKYFEIVNNDMVRSGKKEEYDYYQDSSGNNTNEEDVNEKNTANQLWYQMQDICNNQSPAQKVVSDTNSQLESLLDKTQPVKEIEVGLFSINQLLGRVVNNFEVICTFEYLPEGNTDRYGNKAFPYLLSYQYKVVSWLGELVDNVGSAVNIN